MPITVGLIVDALIALGGEAHVNDIAKHIVSTTPGPFRGKPSQTVSARLQERCSDYKAYKGEQDLFESEPRTGVWRFRSWASPPPVEAMPVHEDRADYEAQEGALVLKMHYARERDPKLVAKFKASLTDPDCEACGFNFSEAYGELAAGYIEAHHKRPVALLEKGAKTTIADLAGLCPNCHRIIHRNYPMAVEELAAIMSAPDGYGGYISEAKKTRTTWKEAVLNAIRRMTRGKNNQEFSRQQIIETELANIVAEVEAKGDTPEQTLSRVLQELAAIGAVEFVDGKGSYRSK